MCGIFGIILKDNSKIEENKLKTFLTDLALISEARGKDSSGLVTKNSKSHIYNVIKGPFPISKLIKNEKVEFNLNLTFKEFYRMEKTSSFISFGHSRLVTNGSQLSEYNNQPVIKDGLCGIHNGIIVNVDELWDQHQDLHREYDIDTEVMFALIRKYLSDGKNTIEAYKSTLQQVFGTVATAIAFNDREEFLLGTNNGSLYTLSDYENILIFASERHFLNSLLKKYKLNNNFSKLLLEQVKPNSGLLIDTHNMIFHKFKNGKSVCHDYSSQLVKDYYSIRLASIENSADTKSVVIDVEKFSLEPKNLQKKELLEYNFDRIKELRRCTKCVLPETFPFIKFDQSGVCNYCKNYIKRNQPKSIQDLKKLVEPYRNKNGNHDCLVPLSGGRDSTYILHYVKNVLELQPIAFTYDWGMVTDLARRNIARVCGKLGVENIIVAADIRKKREFIRKNIVAWLKRPSLGMIPLFMAGDKYFFKYANQVKEQNNIQLQVWGFNFLENTDFKVGFAGVEPDWQKKMIYSMSIKRQLKLFKYVATNLLTNPAYFNSSIPDTIGSFFSRYFNPRDDYYHFFDYHEWDEDKIENLLFNEYDWEKSKDLNSTWRIGDGTASFYNYIYYTVAGFSEFDTFKSNQIREEMISREEAITSVYEENQPRYESLKWYLEIIGLDYESVIKKINTIPKLYS